MLAYQEGVYGHHGRIFGELLYHQRACAAADGGFGPYLVQASEGDHAPKGAGGQGVRGKVAKTEEKICRLRVLLLPLQA